MVSEVQVIFWKNVPFFVELKIFRMWIRKNRTRSTILFGSTVNLIWKHFAGTAQTKTTCSSSLRNRWGVEGGLLRKEKNLFLTYNFLKICLISSWKEKLKLATQYLFHELRTFLQLAKLYLFHKLGMLSRRGQKGIYSIS